VPSQKMPEVDESYLVFEHPLLKSAPNLGQSAHHSYFLKSKE
ncbi:hypothetical protein Tco_1189282, partial [Tanacetum coccineum]